MDLERWQRLSPLLDALFELGTGRARAPPGRIARHRSETGGRTRRTDRAGSTAAKISCPNRWYRLAAQPRARARWSGPYRMELLLGEGGMGQVWLAARADGLYQRRVALKLLRPGLADPNLRLRFTRERQILARLEHPHIARLLDAGISNDSQPYLALEYVEGEPITDYCRNRAVPVEARLALFLQICEAVSHAHANLIVHRDLKPSNILVTPGGEVRLLDFGIAKLLDTENKTVDRHPHRRARVHPALRRAGTGARRTGHHHDRRVFAGRGAVRTAHRCETLPAQAADRCRMGGSDPRASIRSGRRRRVLRTTETATAHDAAGLRRRARALSGDLDNITLKALAKRPEHRYASVEALSLDLQRHHAGRPGAGALARRGLPHAQVRAPPSLGAGHRRAGGRGAARCAGHRRLAGARSRARGRARAGDAGFRDRPVRERRHRRRRQTARASKPC